MEITLNDKYTLNNGIRFLTGTQALVRLPLVQIRRDQINKLNTACYISGYRGSPLGGYDQQILKNIDSFLATFSVDILPVKRSTIINFH